MKKILKKILFGNKTKISEILFGAARGIKMEIDFKSKSQRYLGLDEHEVQSKFITNAKNCDTFIDIGASDGYYGLMYRKFNKTGHILLFDAAHNFAEIQKENFRINHFNSANTEFISKYVAAITSENSICLDDYLNKNTGNVFLKIDVDGGELEVLKGISSTLEETNCKLILETHSKQLEKDCIKLLSGYGYKCTIIVNAWWRIFIPELRPIEHNRWFSAEK